jgi:hypothetical protein
MAGDCTPQAKSRNKAVEVPLRTGVKQPLRLVVELNCKYCYLDEQKMYFSEWIQQSKSVTELCCRKMQLCEMCTWVTKAWLPHSVLGLHSWTE